MNQCNTLIDIFISEKFCPVIANMLYKTFYCYYYGGCGLDYHSLDHDEIASGLLRVSLVTGVANLIRVVIN